MRIGLYSRHLRPFRYIEQFPYSKRGEKTALQIDPRDPRLPFDTGNLNPHPRDTLGIPPYVTGLLQTAILRVKKKVFFPGDFVCAGKTVLETPRETMQNYGRKVFEANVAMTLTNKLFLQTQVI